MSFPHDVLSGPMDFAKWIEEIRPQLQPPVGERQAEVVGVALLPGCRQARSTASHELVAGGSPCSPPPTRTHAGNKLMFGGQQKIMVVGGPNTREDYHIEEGEVRVLGRRRRG